MGGKMRCAILLALVVLAILQTRPTDAHGTDIDAHGDDHVGTSDHDHHEHAHHVSEHAHDHDHKHEALEGIHTHENTHGHEHDHRHVEHDHDDHTHDHAHGAHSHGHDHHDHDHAHVHDHDHAHVHAHTHTHSHHTHEHGVHSKSQRKQIDRFSPSVWMEALFATALVGAAPVVVLLFVPLGLGNQEAQKPLLRVFLSFAAGGLLGDSLLHLLPHSIPSGHGHSHDHSHEHSDHHEGHAHSVQDLAVWLYCIAGMMTFLMLEKFVRAQTGDSHGHSHSHGIHNHSHSSSPTSTPRTTSDSTTRKRVSQKVNDNEPKEAEKTSIQDTTTSKPQHKTIAAAGYLNLAADFSHNFTDGLAIGATFLRGSGWQTTVAMLLHELPHEIGDFAILIQSGFSRREAMLTQLLTAIGAMFGTAIGLLIEGAGDSSSAWISPFTAGGFIYIACASVMPELLEDCSFYQSVKEGVAMCLGIGLMIIIALNE